MLMYCAFTPDSVFKSVPPNGSEATWQTSMLYSDVVPLIYVKETICMVICPPTRFKSIVLWPGMTLWCQDYSKIHLMDEGPGAILSFKTFLSFINRLLVTMAPHSSTLAWKIPWTEEPWWAAVHGVIKSWTRLNDFTFTFHFHALEKEMATHSSVLTWRIPGMGEPGGLPSLGLHSVRHDWSDLAAASAAAAARIYMIRLGPPR